MYFLNEDKISGGEAIKVLPATPPVTEDHQSVHAQAVQADRDNTHVYDGAILEGIATVEDLEGLPPALRAEVLRILEEHNQNETGQ